MLVAYSRSTWPVPALGLALFLAVGALVPANPIAAGAIVGAAISLSLVAMGRATARFFILMLAALLMGYAIMGRGFAYLGFPPLYVGEATLALGILAVFAALPMRRLTAVHLLILAFMAWGLVRTVPYVGAYGLAAPRDAVSWGYAAFAITVSLLLQQNHVRKLITWYGRFVWLLVPWIPLFGIVWFVLDPAFPTVPGADVSIPYFKGGDMAVHLAGAAAFVLAGLLPVWAWNRLVEPIFWMIWFAGFVIVAVVNRGGMLAVMVATPAILLFRRAFDRWLGIALTAFFLVAVLATASIELGELRDGRTLSFGQIVENLTSTVGESEDPHLEGTRDWRERWWATIIDYTVRGEHFWLGKGYGINLAEDDGFLGQNPDLRAPHNAHLQFLARGGVPNLVLWIATQSTFAFVLLRSAYRCARSGSGKWVAVHGWIFVYWTAALINMSFDVYIEGPQGGILFWSLVGLGLGTVAIVGERTAEDSVPPATSSPSRD